MGRWWVVCGLIEPMSGVMTYLVQQREGADLTEGQRQATGGALEAYLQGDRSVVVGRR